MDVVIPLGPQSKWGHNEARYALRSLFKYSEVGTVFIVGEKPKFFNWGSGVEHIACEDVSKYAKELRIWLKVKKACEDPRVSEDFFFSNDDYFFLKPFSVSEYPNYHKGDLREFLWSNEKFENIKSGYDRKSQRTKEFLLKNNRTTFMFDIHRPNRVNKKDFLECFENVKQELFRDGTKSNASLLINTTYLNWVGAEGVETRDVKLSSIKDLPEDAEIFSVSDRAMDSELKKFLNSNFNKHLEFELDYNFINNMRSNSTEKVTEKVKFVVNKRFVYEGQQYGPGTWKLLLKTAELFEREKRGHLEHIGYPRVPEEKVTQVKLKQSNAKTKALPESFPHRAKLLEAGYATVESLKAEGIESELVKIKGLGRAAIVKIGLALNETVS